MDEPVQFPTIEKLEGEDGIYVITFGKRVSQTRLDVLAHQIEDIDAQASETVTVVMDPGGDPRQVRVTFAPADDYLDRHTIQSALGQHPLT